MTERPTGTPRRGPMTLLVRSVAACAVILGVGLAACASPSDPMAQGGAAFVLPGPDNTSP